MKCILNVTDHEYAKILQWTHDAVEWDNSDRCVLNGLTNLLGSNVVEQLLRYDECHMAQHDDVSSQSRVQPAPTVSSFHL
jgi:hypothetical protein